MEKINVFRVILLSILVWYTVCEVEKEPNHSFAESSPQEVTGFKNPSARHADVPLRSRQHKFPVPISTMTDSFSSDVERIGPLDERVLPASKNAQKSIKWTKDEKIRNVSTMRKSKFAMRRSARRHSVLKPSHGTEMSSSASILKESEGKKTFTFQKTAPSSITSASYKTKITTPFKLFILPAEETVIPSVDKADVETDWLSKEDNTTKQDDQTSSHNNDKEDSSSLHDEPNVTGHEGSTRHAGTSATPQHKMAVHPGLKASSGLRWKAAYDHIKLYDSKKGKQFKYKKKKSRSEDEEPVDSSSPAATVAGILAGILMLLFIFTGVPRLWRISNQCWQRRTCQVLETNFLSTGYCSEEQSEEEIIFERSVMERNKESSESNSPRTTPDTSLGRSQSLPSSYQSPDFPTGEQKIRTLTDTPRSTPLMTVPILDETARTDVLMSKEIPSTSLSDSLNVKPTERRPSVSLTSVPSISLASEMEVCDSDLVTVTRSSPPAEQTSLESSLSPHPSRPSLPLLPTASDESTPSIFIASDSTSSSTESCKTPVAARHEVVITVDDADDDENIIYSRNNLEASVVRDSGKRSSKAEVVITMGLNEEESSVISESESESSLGEIISKTQEAEMRNVTTGDAIIDIIGSENDNEKPSVINEKSSQGRTRPRDAVKTKVKREVRWQDKSTNPVNAGASTSSSAKIRVLNHKDYKTWKELQKNIKIKKAQGIKPRDVVPGLQIIRDIYNLPRIPVDSEGGCLCYYCEKHIKRAQREKFFKMPSKLFSLKSKSTASECPSGSEGSSTSSAAKIRVLNHKDYKTWKELQKDIAMKKAQGIKPRDVLQGLQITRDIYNLPRIPVDSEGGCLCYYCEKHIKRARRGRCFKLPRFDR